MEERNGNWEEVSKTGKRFGDEKLKYMLQFICPKPML
jgi:hypothetical protein